MFAVFILLWAPDSRLGQVESLEKRTTSRWVATAIAEAEAEAEKARARSKGDEAVKALAAKASSDAEKACWTPSSCKGSIGSSAPLTAMPFEKDKELLELLETSEAINSHHSLKAMPGQVLSAAYADEAAVSECKRSIALLVPCFVFEQSFFLVHFLVSSQSLCYRS